MSNLLTITLSTNAVDDYFINDIPFTNTLVFRTTWFILEDFEKNYHKQVKKIPNDFVEDMKKLIENSVRTETAAYNLQMQFQYIFDNSHKIQEFRIPKAISDFGTNSANLVHQINTKLESSVYNFLGKNKYRKSTPTEIFLKDHDLYKEIFNLFLYDETDHLQKDPQSLDEDEYQFYNRLTNSFEREAFIHGNAFACTREILRSSLEDFNYDHGLDAIHENIKFKSDGDWYIFDLNSIN